jgi:hypothetical protein
MLKGQAICKDCGNGTLNNERNPQFILSDDENGVYTQCANCGSTHINGELYTTDGSYQEESL